MQLKKYTINTLWETPAIILLLWCWTLIMFLIKTKVNSICTMMEHSIHHSIHSPVVLIMYEWCSPVPDDKLTKEYIASYGGYTVDTYYSYGDSFSECNKKDSTAIHQCCFWETPSTMFLRKMVFLRNTNSTSIMVLNSNNVFN